MTRAQLKSLAKKNLEGNWGLAIGAIFTIGGIGFLSGFAIQILAIFSFMLTESYFLVFILTFCLIFLLIPLQLGLHKIHMSIGQEANPSFNALFYGYKENQVGRIVITMILYVLYIYLWFLLLIIPGIIKSFSYYMVPYILMDEDYKHLSHNEAITESRRLMHGQKLNLFVLQISFFFWYLLIPITFGLASLYVTPYVQQTTAQFYLELKKEKNIAKVAEENLGNI